MIRLILGCVFIVLGLPFFIRGLIFSTKPDHQMTRQAKERNLRLGLETDMLTWGRKVRRFGFLLLVIGATLAAFGALAVGADSAP
jgi:hypothetical protein